MIYLKRNYFSIISTALAGINFFSGVIYKAINPVNTAVSGANFGETLAKTMEMTFRIPQLIAFIPIILGIIGLVSYSKNNAIKGKAMAIIGITLGVIQFIFCTVLIAISQNAASFTTDIISPLM